MAKIIKRLNVFLKRVILSDLFKDLASFLLTLSLAIILVRLLLNKIIPKNSINNNAYQCNFEHANYVFIVIIAAATIISFWYFRRGKSVKAFNDFTLFFSAAISGYDYIFAHEAHLNMQSVAYMCSEPNVFIWHLCLIIASFAKAFIAFIEFLAERSKEIRALKENDGMTDKEVFLAKMCRALISLIKNTH